MLDLDQKVTRDIVAMIADSVHQVCLEVRETVETPDEMVQLAQSECEVELAAVELKVEVEKLAQLVSKDILVRDESDAERICSSFE